MSRVITITEALRELKLYDNKINKAINSVMFVGSKKKSSDKVGVVNVDKFNQDAISGYQSVIDLMENQDMVKKAVVQSNAVTTVEINGIKYTVAEAIDTKKKIENKKLFLGILKAQYATAQNSVIRENKRVDTQIDNMLEKYVGKDSDKKISEMDFSVISDPYRERNEFELVDPIKIADKIKELEDFIDGFESEVDVKLAISNSITHIEIE